jgi:hypothetical protein
MNRTTFRSGAFAALAIGAMLATGGLVTAGGVGAAAAAESADVERWVVPQTQQGGEYWTPARMKAATPGDVLVADNVASAATTNSAPVAVGPKKSVAKQSPTLKARPVPALAPVSHIGKVFFTLGGANYVCSGNAISARKHFARRTPSTGPGAFASRFTFVPAYNNGAASRLQATGCTPHPVASGGDINYDTAAIVASPTGTSLSDMVMHPAHRSTTPHSPARIRIPGSSAVQRSNPEPSMVPPA